MKLPPHGKRVQLLTELKKRGGNYLPVDTKELWKPALYLADRLEQAINKTSPAPAMAMSWFRQVADLFSKAELPVHWELPSGFLGVQKYVEVETEKINTFWGEQRVRTSFYRDTDRIAPSKMKAGISPNVIHSLDAAHLTCTVNAALDSGITSFSMIHDSYGCHAGGMQELSRLLRQEFVNIYKEDVLINLYHQFQRQLPEVEVPTPPEYGALDVSEVLKSDYFFA